MKQSIRFLSVYSIGLCVMMLASQAVASPAMANVTNITVWHGESDPTALNQIVTDFETLHPEINVSLQLIPFEDLLIDYQSTVSDGTGPALMRGPNDWVGVLANDNLLQPVDEGYDLSQYIAETVTATEWQGKHWAVPDTYGNHLMLFFNKSLLASAPTNTDDLIDVAKSLTGGGNYGFVYNLNEPFWLIPWLTGYGGWVLDEAGNPVTPTLYTPEMVDALQFAHDLRWVHAIVPPGTVDYATADNLFRDGKAAMIINGDWSLGAYIDLFGSNLGVAKIPLMSDTGDWPQPMTGGKFYFFNPNNSQAVNQASKLFVEYASSKPAQLLWADQNVLPALTAAFNDPAIQSDPILQASAAQLSLGRLSPSLPEMTCVWGAMPDPIAQVMANTLTPTQAAIDMQSQANACTTTLQKNAGWEQSSPDGFGDSNSMQIPSLAVFKGQLYAGIWNSQGAGLDSAQIWRSSNGFAWEMVNEKPVNGAAALIVFEDYIYAGSWNGWIWRSMDGENWENVITNGFGDPNNGIAHFAVYKDYLYASTWNGTSGSQIWRTSNGTQWDVFSPGIDGNPNNGGAISSAEFQNNLYWGVTNSMTGAQLWRTDGVSLTSVNKVGFGDSTNTGISALQVFQGKLYATMWREGSIKIYRSSDGSQWTQVVNGNIGNPGSQFGSALEVYNKWLYLAVNNEQDGLEIWRSPNGTLWQQVGIAGFGDRNNTKTYWDNAMSVFENQLYVGVSNFSTGGEVWRLSKPDHSIFLPLISQD